MAPRKSADWKTNGTYRLTIELPSTLWEDVKTWAEANGVRGSQANGGGVYRRRRWVGRCRFVRIQDPV